MIAQTVSDGVCVLQFNAPPLSTITFSLLTELGASIRRASDDPQVAGIIITGSPSHFSAGADIGIFKEISWPSAAASDLHGVNSCER